ncbi:hypothetical protein BHM03_00023088 [Ensete ventricosum]|nr:hypothetical protein BHM03_00023088 [Ensete ventricosum]
MIGYRSRDRFELDRRSDFATELAPESGRLRELPRLGAMAIPSQAGPPGSGLLATPFAGVPSGEPCLDMASEAEESLGRDNERSRVGSRRDPSDGQVSSVVDFATPLLHRGPGAFIVTITEYPYLNPLSSLLLTIPLHLTMSSVVLAARRAPAGKGCRHCPPYLCQVGSMTANPFMSTSGRLPVSDRPR